MGDLYSETAGGGGHEGAAASVVGDSGEPRGGHADQEKSNGRGMMWYGFTHVKTEEPGLISGIRSRLLLCVWLAVESFRDARNTPFLALGSAYTASVVLRNP